MTQTEKERLAVVETKVDGMKEDITAARKDIAGIRSDIKQFIEAQAVKDEEAAKLFVTRLEAKAYAAGVSLLISLIALFFLVKDHLK